MDVFTASAEATSKSIGSPFDKVNERAAKYAATRSGELIKGLDTTTLDRIRAAETAAFKTGLSPKQFAGQIETIIGDPARALNIAKTEIATAQMDAALAAAEASGLATGKRSLLSNNHEVEDVCDDCADAGLIPLGEEFPSGTMTPPFHPGGCGCDMVVEIE